MIAEASFYCISGVHPEDTPWSKVKKVRFWQPQDTYVAIREIKLITIL